MRRTIMAILLVALLATAAARPVAANTIVYPLVSTLDPASTGPQPTGTFQIDVFANQAFVTIAWGPFTHLGVVLDPIFGVPTDCPGMGTGQYLALFQGICPSGAPRYFLQAIAVSNADGIETDEVTIKILEGTGQIIAAPLPSDFTPGLIGLHKSFTSSGTFIIPAKEPPARGFLVIGLIAAAIVAAISRQRSLLRPGVARQHPTGAGRCKAYN